MNTIEIGDIEVTYCYRNNTPSIIKCVDMCSYDDTATGDVTESCKRDRIFIEDFREAVALRAEAESLKFNQ